jgi:DNA-binding PadR family transcriptional regulator
MFSVDDWVLLIAKRSGRALDVRLQFLMFILWKDYRVGRRVIKFEPHMYGMWSRELDSIIDRLVLNGYLSVDTVEGTRGGVRRVYTPTERGLRRVRRREPLMALANLAAYITVRQWARAPLRYLIGHVYVTYPKYTVGALPLGLTVMELEDAAKHEAVGGA